MKAFKPLLIALALLCPALTMAQDFPNKTIRLIVPFPPGGPNDIIARVVGQRMSEILKQTIVIDNRSGQGGVRRHRRRRQGAARRLHHRHHERRRAGHQPQHGEGRLRHAQGPAADHPGRQGAGDAGGRHQRAGQHMKELVALAKAQPGKLNFASSGPGSLPHLAGELVQAHRQDRHRARALSRRGARRERPARPSRCRWCSSICRCCCRRSRPASSSRSRSAPRNGCRARPMCRPLSRPAWPNLQTENWYGMVAPAKTPPHDRRHAQQGRGRSDEGSRSD